MAAPCSELLRVLAARGLCQIASPFTVLKASSIGYLGKSSVNRSLHCHHGTTRMGVKVEPPKTMEELRREQAEYIPKTKAKNPMKIIGYAWIIGLPSGIIGFILAKREVDKNRLKQLKTRQRMKRANEGDYESERFNRLAKKAE